MAENIVSSHKMLVFKLLPAIDQNSNFVSDGGEYGFILKELEEDLKKTKSKLDDPYKNKNAYKIFLTPNINSLLILVENRRKIQKRLTN